jgi:hypothetical protein
MRPVAATKTHARRVIRLAPAGTPDILVLHPYGFLEIKTATGEIRASQVLWHRTARGRGVRVAVVRSIGEALQVVGGWAHEDEARRAPRKCRSEGCPLEDPK